MPDVEHLNIACEDELLDFTKATSEYVHLLSNHLGLSGIGDITFIDDTMSSSPRSSRVMEHIKFKDVTLNGDVLLQFTSLVRNSLLGCNF